MAARDLLTEALGLPAAERGRMVRELIRSLDKTADVDPAEVERAWGSELDRRAAEVSSDSSARDLNDVCDELDARRGSKA
jgi:putative addiction module component (TIGR02574 family)